MHPTQYTQMQKANTMNPYFTEKARQRLQDECTALNNLAVVAAELDEHTAEVLSADYNPTLEERQKRAAKAYNLRQQLDYYYAQLNAYTPEI